MSLIGRIAVAVQEAHADRLNSPLPQIAGQFGKLGIIGHLLNSPICEHSLLHREHILRSDERARKLNLRIIHVVTALVARIRTSLERLSAQEAFGPSADAHRLVRLANEGDAQARAILAEIGRYLGSGMGSFVNVFAPELVVIGGGFGVAAWEYVIPPAEEVMRREALRPMRGDVRVVRAELGTAAGLIGAAFVAFEALDASS